jgi:xyloglucan-specific exo-beta-1,4-glucanase
MKFKTLDTVGRFAPFVHAPAGGRLRHRLSVGLLTLCALLAACGGGGGGSGGSTPTPTVTRPASPTGMTAAAGDNQVTLSWTLVFGATSYNIYRSSTAGQQGSMLGTSSTASYVDITAANGSTYLYQVTAVNSVGEGMPSTQSAAVTPTAPVTVPAAPGSVTAIRDQAQVTLSWGAVTGATSYNVYRSTAQGTQGTLVGTSASAGFSDTTIVSGTIYFYQVTAVNTAGESAASTPATANAATQWFNVKMGGGGYVPGIIYHPTERHLRYARTDVMGAYRWDQASSKWIALTDGFGRAEGGHQGAESIAVDPTDPDVVYMTTQQAVQSGNGRLYYSSNQGATWSHVTLPFPVGSNNQGRAIGERLMVDPNVPSTMFYASRSAGLWKSTNSGLNWTQVTSLSNYVMSNAEMAAANNWNPIGLGFVVFDVQVPTTGFTASGSATQTIYVGVAPDYKALAGLSHHLYKSTDGGATWTGVALPAGVTTAIASNLLHIPHLARAADGMLYVPFTSGPGPGVSHPSSLYKFDGNATWTKLIASGEGSYYGGIGGVAVHGSGPNTRVAFGVSGTWGDASWVQIAMRSSDAGATWQEFGRSGDLDGTLNYHDVTGWVDDLEIDPFDPDHVSYVLGGGLMSTSEAFSAALPRWTFDVEGIEEMVNLAMAAPPPGASYLLASAHGDTGLYVHTSLTTTATRSPSLGFGNGTGIDMAWDNPAFIVGVGSFGGTSKGAYSTDSGATWMTFPTVPSVASASGDASRVAVTADGSMVIWAIEGQVPYYTTDRGLTWTATNLPAPPASWRAGYHLAADSKNPLKVYAYNHGGNWWDAANSARFYTSTDGGRTFAASAQSWDPNGNGNTGLAVNPFTEGDIWLADADNLWHSVDSGATWTRLTAMATIGPEPTNVHGAMKVALGAPAPGASYSAAVYFIGTINGTDGVYRSDDAGVTWLRIDDDAHRYGGVSGIVADTSIHGRVFVSGRGMLYNQ